MQLLKIVFEIYSAYVVSFSALLVPVITISIAYIAYQQYRIEKQRVRMELYEKRYRIYKRIMEFIRLCIEGGITGFTEASSFYSDVIEGKFLFNDDVQDLIETLHSNGIRFGELNDKYDRSVKSRKVIFTQEEVKEKHDLSMWFYHEIKHVTLIFKKHLKIV